MSYLGWDVVHSFPAIEAELAFWLRHSDRLTQEERQALAHGQISTVVRPLKPEWSEGDWLQVASNLDVQVQKIRWTRRFYRTTFLMRDFRPNLMRRVPQVLDPPAFDLYGEPIKPTPRAVAAARVDGSYTQSGHLAVPDSAEEVGVEAQEKYADQGVVNYKAVHAERVAKRDIRTVSQKLRRVQGEAARKGIDISPDVKRIKAEVEGIEQKLNEAA